MERLPARPRDDYVRLVESQGLSFHERDGYWTEDACYRFTAGEIDVLEAATAELQDLYGETLERTIAAGRLDELAIPEAFHGAVADSWSRGDRSLYGRFDLVFDGRTDPKLLEYNADTPTSLLEAAVIQWNWKEQVRPGTDQFNSIHERLVDAWRTGAEPGPVAVACVSDHEEDWVSSAYLLDTLVQAGRGGAIVDLSDIAWDPATRWFLDEGNVPIATLFKLYPWEWLMREEFGPHLLNCRTEFIEPLYKAAFSSKGMLPLLWEFFPGHPNLLESTRDTTKLRSYARKPLLSREGQNVTLVRDGHVLEAEEGTYGEEGYVYQALAPLPSFAGAHPVIGSWVIAGEPAGIGIRESEGLITTDRSRVIPHLFE